MTSRGHSARRAGAELWRSARGPVAVGLLVLVTGLVVAALAHRPAAGLLNPEAARPEGSLALVRLLRAEGVAVTAVRTSAEVAAAGPDTTVLVTAPRRLAAHQVDAVRRSAANLLLVDPGREVLAGLAPGVTEETLFAPVDTVPPACALAEPAGPAELGGVLYAAADGVRCYPGDAGVGLVQITAGSRTITVIGTPVPLTNDRLAEEGNAALAMRLLGGKPKLLWYLPMPEAAPVDQRRGLLELLPGGWLWAAAQLAMAAVVTALWRGRRLGPVVGEPLPVAVRAVEVVEGRGRLYRRSGDRGHAAGALRAAARARLRARLALAGEDEPPEVLVDAVHTRTGRPAGELRGLLYGAAPTDDPALVRLADELDALEREVRQR